MDQGRSLDYFDLYRLSEEFQKLCGAQVQSIHYLSDTRYALDMRLPGESRWLVIDLTPSQPFVVSIVSTKAPKTQRKTPILNFLRAHFVDLRLKTLEVAQKPNRTLRLTFDGLSKTSSLTFKCFPHGQHLILTSGEKCVQFPLRPKSIEDDQVSFVEPEKVPGWESNDTASLRFLGPLSNSGETKTSAKETSSADNYKAKLIKRLEKAIRGIEEGAGSGKEQDEVHISKLQQEAQKLQNALVPDGHKIQQIYEEIKKIKRKTLLNATRRNELEAELDKVKKSAVTEVFPSSNFNLSKKTSRKENTFTGTRVKLDDPWELWVGRTAWQNDDLVKLAAGHELWIHLRDYPGAHGVIRGPKKGEPGSSQIEFACCVVAQLSQSKKKPFSLGEKLDFIVTPRKFVKKPKGAEPGKVIVEREAVRRVAFKTVKFEVI